MNIHQLQAFLAVAQDLSFRRAAARLFVSQSALSAQVAELERHLGVRLFQRDRSGTRLSDDGKALLPVARRAVAALAEVELAASRSPRFRRNFVAGVIDHGVGDLTWPLLQAFHDARPDLVLGIKRVGFSDALPWLGSGAIDVLLAVGPFDEEAFEVVTVDSMPVAAIMPTHQPMAEAEVIDAGWLALQVSEAPPPGMGRAFTEFWTLQNVGGPPLHRLRMVDPGLGVAQLLEAIAVGAIGPWPARVPATPGRVIVPLAAALEAPTQLVALRPASRDARDFLRLGACLAATIGP